MIVVTAAVAGMSTAGMAGVSYSAEVAGMSSAAVASVAYMAEVSASSAAMARMTPMSGMTPVSRKRIIYAEHTCKYYHQ